MNDTGYVDYFEVLALTPDAKPGEVRKSYKKLMKELVNEISETEITEERRDRYLLAMARLNAAFYILRDNGTREQYMNARARVMGLEEQWRAAVEANDSATEDLRRQFDRAMRDYLSLYMEELVLEAGRDRECVEASNWDAAHERHAGRVLRYDRHRHLQRILERLPYTEVTRPEVNWEERSRTVAGILAGGSR